MSYLPDDYLDRVYAGVLGKLVGVYVGRPFEGWTHQRIIEELGPIHHYVHEKLGGPLVVTDDDVSGTFAFVRALEEHGATADLSAEQIGKTWLNNVIERRTVFWWGGRGISTEHTAYLNLKKGIPAPQSGSIQTNGKTVAEQIGAQIFIDGWAMVAPGNPELAAHFAKAAGSVSHDGESVYAAMLWAAMESEAFRSKDVDHLLDVGLKHIPDDSLIAQLIGDVRAWAKEDGDWQITRQRIEDKYGYDKFCGVCHVVPNHGIMVMALIYGGHDFHEAIHIINTSGWDTDCNSGNVGCLVAIMHGLAAFEDGPDWRNPLADRALISSADGGYTVNNAGRIAYDITNLGRRLAGKLPLEAPKGGAQFHFMLPGSVQGFYAVGNTTVNPTIIQVEGSHGPALAIRLQGLTKAAGRVAALTDAFLPLEVREMPIYEIGGSPLVYPGQRIKAIVRADDANTAAIAIGLRLRIYNPQDELVNLDQEPSLLSPGQSGILEWTIPDDHGSQPIQAIGIAISTDVKRLHGTIWLDRLGWYGTPKLTLKPVPEAPNEFWRRSFVNGADEFWSRRSRIVVAQNRGEGIVAYGTREWTDYQIVVENFTINIGGPSGAAIRVQGLNRYYALVFLEGNRIALIKSLDDQKVELASAEFDWKLDTPYRIELKANGRDLRALVNEVEIRAVDHRYSGGGCGLVVTEGSIRVDSVDIASVE
ncbi:ADP-ribosylation/Crystallin J1 [Xylariales sp. PMI_506]|nr:ADP-ribosylation/Crystallin J1 [Xylariales sp. PMI_506]